MVALDEYFHHNGTKTRSRCCTTSISPGFRNRPLLIDHCSLIIKRSADAYGSTLIFTAPDTTGNRWGDPAVQSDYGVNENIYCGYRFDAETQLYYVRNRTYNPILGRWIQRDPIGYSGGGNLYEYAYDNPSRYLDPTGFQSPGYPGPITLPPGGAAAAEALAAAIAALADLAWLPWAAAALAGLLLAYALWRAACVELYDAYKAECALAAQLGGCKAKRPCSEYPPKIAAWLSCASGRQYYLDAGCDVIIPTQANHPAAAGQARAAYANCVRLQPTCVPDCPVP